MADLIDRVALLAAGDATKMNVAFEDWNRLDWKTQQHILNFSRAYKRLVESAPAVDAVEVVRCYKCKQSERMSSPYGTVVHCHRWGKDVAYDGYCHEGY